MLLVFPVVLFVIHIWNAWTAGLFDNWSAALLYPSIGLVKGMPIYFGHDTGPVNDLLYGPLFAVFYTPAAFFNTPTPAILTGMFLSTTAFFVPCLLLIVAFGPRAEKRDWPLTIAACVFFAFVVIAVGGTRFSALRLKPDGPALLSSC